MKYEDIINLPHHVSKKRPKMSMENRAAQFAPFAALTGHSAAVDETARLTTGKIDIDEYSKEEINRTLIEIMEKINSGKIVNAKFIYFIPDDKKCGGAYVEIVGKVKKIDAYEHIIIMVTGEIIPIDDVIECSLE